MMTLLVKFLTDLLTRLSTIAAWILVGKASQQSKQQREAIKELQRHARIDSESITPDAAIDGLRSFGEKRRESDDN